MGVRKYRDIRVRGVVYPDVESAAAALNVGPETVRYAIRAGTLHRLGTGRVGPEPMPVRISGRNFKSVAAAAAHFDVGVWVIYRALETGDPDRFLRPRRCNPWKSKPFTIGDLSFPSMRAASRALGFSPNYISVVCSRGSKRGYERILAAAMAHQSQGGGAA